MHVLQRRIVEIDQQQRVAFYEGQDNDVWLVLANKRKALVAELRMRHEELPLLLVEGVLPWHVVTQTVWEWVGGVYICFPCFFCLG